jgi:hypothetical protein
MKNLLYIITLLPCFICCGNDEFKVKIDASDTLTFNGSFATAAYAGVISLSIQNGLYSCYTNWPNGYAAGHVQAEGNSLIFTDTIPAPVQTTYGPSFVLYGPYTYLYDGNTLYLQRNYGGRIRYKMIRQ